MSLSDARAVHFGPFELDLHAAELRHNDSCTKLPEQPFQVLVALVEHPGEVVTREELRRRLWGSDTFVDYEHGLNTAVKRLREVLGDSAENPRYIETLPRHGYRLKVPVQWPKGTVSTNPKTPGRQRKIWLAASAVIVAAVAVGIPWRQQLLERFRPLKIESLAVLPLENLSGPEEEYFADGMTEALLTELSKIGSLKLISRTSVMQYKGTRKSLREIAHELGVAGVVEGSVLRSGNRVRITAQLIDAREDRYLWSASYDRDLRDVLALHREVAQAIADRVRVVVTPEEQRHLAETRRVNPEAYEAYLRGRYHATRFTQEPLRKARDYLQQATNKDPTYAPAYAELAHVYVKLAIGGSADQSASSSPVAAEMLPRAQAAAQKSLELDPSLAQAHTVLGLVSIYWDFDLSEGKRELERAVTLAPDSADALIHASIWRALLGEEAAARDGTSHALEIEPLGVEIGTLAGQVFFRLRDYDGAIAQLQKTLEIEPKLPRAYAMLYRAYEAKRMNTEAIGAYQKVIALNGGTSQEIAAPRIAFAKGGIRTFWLWRLQELDNAARKGFDSPTERARLCALLGDNERALELLEKAYLRRDYTVYAAKGGHEFDNLRPNPRFQELIHRMNLSS